MASTIFLETLNVPCYKIASCEITDHILIKRIAETKKPVIISSGMANQFLAIPLLALSVFWNKKYLIYTIICVLLFLVDGDAFNIKFLRETLNWDYRSTRMMYYPIILVLLLGFLETIYGRKKLNFFLRKIIDLALNKIKTQITFIK